MKKNLLIFGGALVLFFVGKNIYKNLLRTINDVKYKFTNLKFDFNKSFNSGFDRLYFSISLVLENTHNTTINVNEIFFDVFNNGVKIGTVENTTGITIKPNGTTINILDIVLKTENLPTTIQSALKNLINNNSNFVFTFVGEINTNLGTFPVKQNLKIGS
jgi:hypothetical protein